MQPFYGNFHRIMMQLWVQVVQKSNPIDNLDLAPYVRNISLLLVHVRSEINNFIGTVDRYALNPVRT